MYVAHLVDGVVADAQRVGTHVRDETDRAAVLAEIDAFVEPLRDLHRALGRRSAGTLVASCWSLRVVYGAGALRFCSRRVIFATA